MVEEDQFFRFERAPTLCRENAVADRRYPLRDSQGREGGFHRVIGVEPETLDAVDLQCSYGSRARQTE